jgi:hypothetical protein
MDRTVMLPERMGADVRHNARMRIVPLLLLAAVACSSEPPAAGPAAPTEVTGEITAIARGRDGRIAAFTVDAGGRRHEIRIDAERDYGFDLEHLEEHRATGDPVRVTLEDRDGRLYAVEILDA